MKTKMLRRALINSIMSLILCCAMLIGTTYAWFFEKQESKVHTFQTGRLAANVEYFDGTEWKLAENPEEIAKTLLAGTWEPGVPKTMPLRISNVGTMDFTYELLIAPMDQIEELSKKDKNEIMTADADLEDAANEKEIEDDGEDLFDLMLVGYMDGYAEDLTNEELIGEANAGPQIVPLSDGIKIVGELAGTVEDIAVPTEEETEEGEAEEEEEDVDSDSEDTDDAEDDVNSENGENSEDGEAQDGDPQAADGPMAGADNHAGFKAADGSDTEDLDKESEDELEEDDFEGDEITLVIYIPPMTLSEATVLNEQITTKTFGISFVATQIVDEEVLGVLEEIEASEALKALEENEAQDEDTDTEKE